MLLLLVLLLTTGLNLMARENAHRLVPLQAAPVVESCDFVPDPRISRSFVCGDDNSLQPAYVNAPVRFRVNVSGETNLNVTFYFDYLDATGQPIPSSPNVTIPVPWPGPGVNVTVYANWTYSTLNINWTSGDSSLYWVSVLVEDDNGLNGTWVFPFWPVTVSRNSEPTLSGLNSVNFVGSITFPNKLIPRLYVNVSASDPDGDPLTVTWDWGDGTHSVNVTGSTASPVDLNVTHQYSADRFPLNETPRYVQIPMTVWVDDGVGHNLSLPSIAEFFIDFDSPPTVGWDRPTVGSIWKVGEAVPMVGNVSDPEGDPLTIYWDFDNRTDSNGDGNPMTDRDANGTTASHAYTLPGVYNITLWATDGETKKWCLDLVYCTSNATGYVSHWVKQVIPIQVQINRPPILALTNSSAIKGEPAQLRAAVYDSNGDSMTVTWVFGDGTSNATNVTASSSRGSPQTFDIFQNHTYVNVGRYNMTLIVSDGNSTTEDTKEVFVESFNLPPGKPALEVLRANGTASENNTFQLNETVLLRVMLFDPENDTLEVTVDWRDGNISTGQVDFATAQGCMFIRVGNDTRYACPISFSHAYRNIGSNESREYDVVVTVTDHQDYFQKNPSGGAPIVKNHSPNQTAIVIVKNPRVAGLGPWDWWDFSTLAAVVGLPVALVGRWAYKIRKERKEE